VRNERAVTLIELIVVLALIGLVVGISGLALASVKTPRESARHQAFRHAREQAIRTGIPVVIVTNDDRRTMVRFLADGRAVGTDIDPLTGLARDSTR
jgi:prepilin-type N-terminal cleavage/methylation domain-containing protein